MVIGLAGVLLLTGPAQADRLSGASFRAQGGSSSLVLSSASRASSGTSPGEAASSAWLGAAGKATAPSTSTPVPSPGDLLLFAAGVIGVLVGRRGSRSRTAAE